MAISPTTKSGLSDNTSSFTTTTSSATGVLCVPAPDNRRIRTVAGIDLNHADIARPILNQDSSSSSSSSSPELLQNLQAAFKRHRPLNKMLTTTIGPQRSVMAQRKASRSSNLVTTSHDMELDATNQAQPSNVGTEFDRLPRLLSAVVSAEKGSMKKETRLTISEGQDGTETSNGDVLIFPDMIRYRYGYVTPEAVLVLVENHVNKSAAASVVAAHSCYKQL